METKQALNTALAVALVVLVIALLPHPDPGVIGLRKGAGIVARLCYPFFHVSLLHAAVNVWCMLQVVFCWRTPLRHIVTAYVIAVLAPALTTTPTLGLSGVCFALIGRSLFRLNSPWVIVAWVAGLSIVQALLPGSNVVLHLYCFVAGVAVAALTAPLINVNRNR